MTELRDAHCGSFVFSALVGFELLSLRLKTMSVNYTKCKLKKCTLVQTVMPCTGRTAHRGSRGITLLFLDHGTTLEGVRSQRNAPTFFTPGEDPVPDVKEAGWAPRSV